MNRPRIPLSINFLRRIKILEAKVRQREEFAMITSNELRYKHRQSEEFETRIAALEARIKELETKQEITA